MLRHNENLNFFFQLAKMEQLKNIILDMESNTFGYDGISANAKIKLKFYCTIHYKHIQILLRDCTSLTHGKLR